MVNLQVQSHHNINSISLFFFCMLAIVLAVVQRDTRVLRKQHSRCYTSHALVQIDLYSSMHHGVLQKQCLRA